MITRSAKPHSLPTFLIPSFLKPQPSNRYLHNRSNAVISIPPPTPFVPDPQTFLTLIGRQLSQHSAKIPTWDTLFSLSSKQLRGLGVEPARSRRYLLWWREKYRRGEYGIGGDFQNVKDGVAEVRAVEVPKKGAEGKNVATLSPSAVKKIVVNLPPDVTMKNINASEVKAVDGLKIRGAHTIVGPYVEPLKGTDGSVARLKVQEGMWEQRRGHKVDGGERRKVNVRSKRAAKERGTLKV